MEEFTDFFTKKNIKLKFPINLNDTYKEIKEKIFVSYNLKNNLLSDNTIALSNSKSYITNDHMTHEIFKSKNLVVYTFTEELIKYIVQDIDKYLDITINSSILHEIFNGYKSIYTDITKNDIFFTILYILNNILSLNLRKQQLQQLYIDPINIKQTQLINKFNTVNQEFKYIEENYIDLYKGKPVYSIINSIVYFPIISKSNLDISKLIREYPVDNIVPIMLTIENKNPIVKIHKNLSTELVKKWYIKDNKEVKKINGLSFKLKINEDNYANAFLINGKRISVRMSQDAKYKTTFEDIVNNISPIYKFIKNVSKIFPNQEVKLDKPYYGFFNTQFLTKKRIHLSNLILTIKKKFQDVFKLDLNERKKEFVKFTYIPLKTTIFIRYTKNSSGEDINIVDLLGIKNENQLISIINLIVKLLAIADTTKNLLEFKNFKFVTIDDQKTITKKVNKNINNIKNLGFKLDTISCQRERQPIKMDKSHNSSINTISYLGNLYKCPNPEYPYPGFTNKNTLCCFKKNQTNKEVYKKNMLETLNIPKVTDEEILKYRIISTNKLLSVNRLGLLPSLLYNIFNKDYLRLGAGNELVNVLNKATNITIQNNISDNNKLDKLFNVNIIIFNLQNDQIVCKEINKFPYPNTVFILKNDSNNYELIVKKINNKLYRIFKTTDDITIKILDIYKKSCIVNYIGYPETPMTYADIPFTIEAQIINKFNKVIYVFTKEAGLIPVVPTKLIPETKIVNIANVKINAIKQLNLIKNFNDIKYIQISGQITSDNFTIGLVTKSGLIIPTKKSKKIPQLPIVYRQIIDNIDDLIYDNASNKDNRYVYMTSVNYYKELYNRLKYTLSKKINNDTKQALENAIKNNLNIKKIIDSILKNEITFIDKTKIQQIPSSRNICTDLKNNCNSDPFCKKIKNNCLISIENNIYNAFLERLSIEIMWNKNIITGNIISEFYDDNKFIKRKKEIILLGKDNVNKFFFEKN